MTCGHLSMEWGLCAGGWGLRVGGSRRPVGALAAASGVVAGLVVAGPAGAQYLVCLLYGEEIDMPGTCGAGCECFQLSLDPKKTDNQREC